MMTDTPAETLAKKPVKRKKTRRSAAPASAPAEKLAYPGLTEADCAKACSQKGCAISGNLTCAHPRKGGLRGPDMSDPEALKRMQQAQKQLAGIAAAKRFS